VPAAQRPRFLAAYADPAETAVEALERHFGELEALEAEWLAATTGAVPPEAARP
jgi:hypothetical protein